MSDTLNEQLSALLDGELPPEETELLLKRLERDPDLRTTLARYRAVGDALRGDRVRASEGFGLRLSHALAAEAPHVPPATTAAPALRPAPRRAVPRWLQSVGGLAVAASVAAVAVVVLQGEPATDPAVPVAATSTVLPAATPVEAPRILSPQPGGPAPAFAVAPAARLAGLGGSGEPLSYVTPPSSAAALGPIGAIPEARLATYVVAHAEFSSPLGRRNVLTGLIVEQAPAAGAR